MASSEVKPPPVRACLFDMDGLLLNTEDLYTICTNEVLHKYGKPDLPWNIKAKLQGRPGPQAGAIFHAWAQLPISEAEFLSQQSVLQKKYFPSAGPLPGVPSLLSTLRSPNTKTATEQARPIHLALATSSHRGNFSLKTTHLEDLFSAFPASRRVLGDDERVPKGRGKPLPDIYLLALGIINAELAEARQAGQTDEPDVRPEECLVFEDSVPGVEAGRRAGMQVVWCPHEGLLKEYEGREHLVLAGAMGEHEDVGGELDGKPGSVGDGWAVQLKSLEGFDYGRFGIVPGE